jgi:hypothetical protein
MTLSVYSRKSALKKWKKEGLLSGKKILIVLKKIKYSPLILLRISHRSILEVNQDAQ